MPKRPSPQESITIPLGKRGRVPGQHVRKTAFLWKGLDIVLTGPDKDCQDLGRDRTKWSCYCMNHGRSAAEKSEKFFTLPKKFLKLL
jgi:hypothetical protein